MFPLIMHSSHGYSRNYDCKYVIINFKTYQLIHALVILWSLIPHQFSLEGIIKWAMPVCVWVSIQFSEVPQLIFFKLDTVMRYYISLKYIKEMLAKGQNVVQLWKIFVLFWHHFITLSNWSWHLWEITQDEWLDAQMDIVHFKVW